MAKIPLGKRAAPSAAAVSALAGLRMLPVGAPIDPSKLTPLERQQLAALDVDTSKPIPANMAEIVAAAKRAATDAANPSDLPVPADTPPIDVDPSKIVNLADLPKAHQQELQQAITQMQTLASAPQVAGAAPGVNRAMQVAFELEQREPLQQAAAPAEPEPPPATDKAGLTTTSHCPHCHWDLSQPFPVEVSIEDKRQYKMVWFGKARFTKRYEILGGDFAVTFRGLLTSEKDAVRQQLGSEVRKELLMGEGEFLERSQAYRLALSLVSIEFPGGMESVPEMYSGDYDFGELAPGETGVPLILQHVKDTVLTQETMYRKVGQLFMEFQRYLEVLEASADTPDFFKGIGLPR